MLGKVTRVQARVVVEKEPKQIDRFVCVYVGWQLSSRQTSIDMLDASEYYNWSRGSCEMTGNLASLEKESCLEKISKEISC